MVESSSLPQELTMPDDEKDLKDLRETHAYHVVEDRFAREARADANVAKLPLAPERKPTRWPNYYRNPLND